MFIVIMTMVSMAVMSVAMLCRSVIMMRMIM